LPIYFWGVTIRNCSALITCCQCRHHLKRLNVRQLSLLMKWIQMERYCNERIIYGYRL